MTSAPRIDATFPTGNYAEVSGTPLWINCNFHGGGAMLYVGESIPLKLILFD